MNKDPDKDIIMKLSTLLPPPASSIRSVHCVGCGAKNSAQRKYCGKCGNHLWDPCINCGESNSAEEEFCGSCGTNLKAALSKIDRPDRQGYRPSQISYERMPLCGSNKFVKTDYKPLSIRI